MRVLRVIVAFAALCAFLIAAPTVRARGDDAFRVVDLDEAVRMPEALFPAMDDWAAEASPMAYTVYQNSDMLKRFDDRQAAFDYARSYERAAVVAEGTLYEGGAPSETPMYAFGVFAVYQGEERLRLFTRWQDAAKYAGLWDDTAIRGVAVVWHNYGTDGLAEARALRQFGAFDGAVRWADAQSAGRLAVVSDDYGAAEPRVSVFPALTKPTYALAADVPHFARFVVAAAAYGRAERPPKPPELLWAKAEPSGYALTQGVPRINQFPQLPRGCEVTSLAMLLGYHGITADKMALARQVRKSPIPFDDPNNGFIGDMYSFRTHGLGVYHAPIAELAERYAPGRVLDATGVRFDDLLYYLDNGLPVWVVVNMDYRLLPASAFETWQTPTGAIQITYREHSVVVIGYDDANVYFNDPLTGEEGFAPRGDFAAAWEQMGHQAVTILQ